MLVESLVVSSHEFSFFPLCFRNTIKNHKYLLFYVPTSLCFTILFSSYFFVLFSFVSLKYWRNINTHVNIPVKFLSLPVPVDSTRLASCYNGSIEEAKERTFNSWFQNIYFHARFSPDQILAPFSGIGTIWFHIFVNFSSLFFCVQVKVLALQRSTLAFVWFG